MTQAWFLIDDWKAAVAGTVRTLLLSNVLISARNGSGRRH
jgi:hypothetical protein